jgi:hypothetical protein
MPLPPGWPTVQVYGTYLRLDGNPASGSVWFETAQPVVINNALGVPIGVLPRRQIATLDANGHFSINLPCTDGGGSPTGWTYQVSEKFDGGQPDYSIEVPQALANQGINLAVYPHATPVPVNPPVVTYLKVSDIGTLVGSQTDVTNAVNTANNASTQANNAVTTANTANTNASNALTVANGIAGTANTALANSNTAINTANAASATANGIAGTANTALANANAAVATANQAETDATNALNTANGIAGTANTALTNSQNAVNTANAAQTTANAALPATSNAVSASKWQTPRTLSLTGDVTGSTSVDGSANAAIAATIPAHSVALSKINPAGSTAGQFMQSTGTGTDAVWGDAPLGFKNKLINGNFNFWQRATTATLSSGAQYVADRWKNYATGTSVTVSQQAFVLGQTAVPYEPQYFHRSVVTSVVGTNNLCVLQQPIESVRTLAGQACTLSFWAKADANRNIALEYFQDFGSGGSPSPQISIPLGLVALTTAWQKYTLEVTLPSITGKTMGTNNNDTLQINFWFDAGSVFATRASNLGQQSGTFDIAQVQIESGAVATTFDNRPIGIELALCQRYYEKNYDLGVLPGTANQTNCMIMYFISLPSATYQPSIMVTFKVAKRVSPSVIVYSQNTGAAGKMNDVLGSADVAATVGNVSTHSFLTFATANAARTSYNIQFMWSADAEF